MFRLFRFFPRQWWSPRAWRIWKTYIHWRLETYGVYYPTGEKSNKALRSMLTQLPSYIKWLKDLDTLSSKKRLS